MWSRYLGKSVRLNDLSDEVLHFFEARNFKVSIEKKPPRVLVSASPAEGLAAIRIADVTLTSGTDGSLTVTFEGFEGSLLSKNSLLPLFGGGFLTLKSLKSSEILARLERDFWDMVDKFIASQ
jgi:hypothetical protein